MENHFNSLSKIRDYHGPLLISHGNADRVIPVSHGKRLFSAANEPKKFYLVGGGDHNSTTTNASVRGKESPIGSANCPRATR